LVTLINELFERYPLKDEEGNDIKDPTYYMWFLTGVYNQKKTEFDTLVLKNEELKSKVEALRTKIKDNYYIPAEGEPKNEKSYWNKAVFEAPDQLNFWFDFLDT
jgi:hypothetical protein